MNENELDWATCLDRVRQRDEQAARELVEWLHHHVERIVRSYLPHAEDVEDLMQEWPCPENGICSTNLLQKVLAHRYDSDLDFARQVSCSVLKRMNATIDLKRGEL
jgi:hypothetical protein